MKMVETRRPSFPDVALDRLLSFRDRQRWQVVCGDLGHWRMGIYSPAESSRGEITELEQHDCPELFVLLAGCVTLVLAARGRVREVALRPGRPVLVAAPHSGYCPGGPHTGTALVVERDEFRTEYRRVEEWLNR